MQTSPPPPFDAEQEDAAEAADVEQAQPRVRWGRYALGAALIGGLVVLTARRSEGAEFVRLLTESRPGWLLAGLLLQVPTYVAQAEVWGCVLRRGQARARPGLLFNLSLAKHFMDNAIPSGGLSGTLLMGRRLEREGVTRQTVVAGVVVNLVSYYGATVLAVCGALAVLAMRGQATPVVWAVGATFNAAALCVMAAVTVLSRGRGRRAVPSFLLRRPRVARTLALLGSAEPEVVRRARPLLEATLQQALIILLDVATVWALLRAVGAEGSAWGVYASFVLSSLIRIVNVLPGGVGVFEAASVGTLAWVGVELPAALAATLLFQGFSFWLPMAPGLYFARRALRAGRAVPP